MRGKREVSQPSATFITSYCRLKAQIQSQRAALFVQGEPNLDNVYKIRYKKNKASITLMTTLAHNTCFTLFRLFSDKFFVIFYKIS